MRQTEAFESKRFSLIGDFFIAFCSASLFCCYLKPENFSDYSITFLIGLGSFLYYRFLHSFSHGNNRYQLSGSWCIGSALWVFGMLRLRDKFDLINPQNLIAISVLLVYQTPFGKFKLRDIPYLKSILIAACWCYFLVWWPLQSQRLMTFSTAILLFENFLFILALTIIYDSYDRKQDETYGLKTLVNYRLSRFSDLIIIGLILISSLPGLIFGSAVFSLDVKVSFYAQVITSVLATILWFNRKKLSRKYLFIWDGFILLKAMIILALYRLI